MVNNVIVKTFHIIRTVPCINVIRFQVRLNINGCRLYTELMRPCSQKNNSRHKRNLRMRRGRRKQVKYWCVHVGVFLVKVMTTTDHDESLVVTPHLNITIHLNPGVDVPTVGESRVVWWLAKLEPPLLPSFFPSPVL